MIASAMATSISRITMIAKENKKIAPNAFTKGHVNRLASSTISMILFTGTTFLKKRYTIDDSTRKVMMNPMASDRGLMRLSRLILPST
jgi:hypothetical protein